MISIKLLFLFAFLSSFVSDSVSECNGNANYLFDKLIKYAKDQVPERIDLRDYIKDIDERKNGITYSSVITGVRNFKRPDGANGNTCFVLDGRYVRALAKIEVTDVKATGYVDYKQKIGEILGKRSVELFRRKRWGGWSSIVKAVENAGNNIAAEVKRVPNNVASITKTVSDEVARVPDNVASISKTVSDEIARVPDNVASISKTVSDEIARTPDNLGKAWDELKSIPDNVADLIKKIRIDSSVDFEGKLDYFRLRVGLEADLETKKLRITDYEVEEIRGFNVRVSRLGGLVYFFEWARGFINKLIPQQRIVNIGKDELKKALQKAVDNYVFDIPLFG